jgi:hypothetical protein
VLNAEDVTLGRMRISLALHLFTGPFSIGNGPWLEEQDSWVRDNKDDFWRLLSIAFEGQLK